MEVDFSEQDALRPNQPPQLDAKILWDEFADLRQKLGRFGRGYMHGYAALGSWEKKVEQYGVYGGGHAWQAERTH
jgi:hypothetical protein